MAKRTIPHSISLETAVELTTNYRENRPVNYPICETFEKDSIIQMLSHPHAGQMRIYLGEKENGLVCTVLCAVDANGYDILPGVASSREAKEEDDALILEDSYRCPEACPPNSPLNP